MVEQAVVVVLLLQAGHAEAEGRCGARTAENEGLKLAERGYGCCHLLHSGAINALVHKVQEDDVGVGLQPQPCASAASAHPVSAP